MKIFRDWYTTRADFRFLFSLILIDFSCNSRQHPDALSRIASIPWSVTLGLRDYYLGVPAASLPSSRM